MEELQDAIEDAQYMNAMNDSTPRPTKAWQFPTSAEVTDYVNKQLSQNPRSLDVDVVCQGSLGFFMVSRFSTVCMYHSIFTFLPILYLNSFPPILYLHIHFILNYSKNK